MMEWGWSLVGWAGGCLWWGFLKLIFSFLVFYVVVWRTQGVLPPLEVSVSYLFCYVWHWLSTSCKKNAKTKTHKNTQKLFLLYTTCLGIILLDKCILLFSMSIIGAMMEWCYLGSGFHCCLHLRVSHGCT